MAIANPVDAAEQRVTLGNVSWQTYVDLCENADCPRGRLTYDQEELEILSPSYLRENVGRIIGRMIEPFAAFLPERIYTTKSPALTQLPQNPQFAHPCVLTNVLGPLHLDSSEMSTLRSGLANYARHKCSFRFASWKEEEE